MDKQKLIDSFKKSAKSLWRMFPVIFGTILLVSIANTLIPKEFYKTVFTGNILSDSFLGSTIGSILLGNPVVSYIIGGELLKQNVSLIAVTAFIVAWVTVGVVQTPAEVSILGKRFTLIRNITAFFISILVAIVTVFILNIFGLPFT